jgi:tRNA threonylcarbamoyladenosine biosynthesis protein TsaB
VILAIETATDVPSVAVLDERALRAQRMWDRPRDALRWLITGIDGALADAAIERDGIAAVAVSIGPGSFTGLRIGIAAAAGWSRAGAVPVYAVPTLEALAHRAPRRGLVAPILDAKRSEVAFAVFGWREGGLIRLVDETTCAPDEAAARIAAAVPAGADLSLLGDGVHTYPAAFRAALPGAVVLPRTVGTPRAEHVGAVARRAIAESRSVPLPELVPRYGRAPRLRSAGGEETADAPANR